MEGALSRTTKPAIGCQGSYLLYNYFAVGKVLAF